MAHSPGFGVFARRAAFHAFVALLFASSAQAAAALAPGDRYVAMGSSFAAAPGVGTPADHPATRCARSAQNYAHLVAARLELTLIDVSCSGATTANIIGPWNELPPQIEAVTADTKLVTLTIGGNDLSYVGNLMAASCAHTAAAMNLCPKYRAPGEERFDKVKEALHHLISEIRSRAPHARIVLVDYPRVLPEDGACTKTPMSGEQATIALSTAKRLAAITARVAEAEEVELVKASEVTRGHDACAAHPWMNGYLTEQGSKVRVPYHPNGEGMHAVADALVAHLAR